MPESPAERMEPPEETAEAPQPAPDLTSQYFSDDDIRQFVRKRRENGSIPSHMPSEDLHRKAAGKLAARFLECQAIRDGTDPVILWDTVKEKIIRMLREIHLETAQGPLPPTGPPDPVPMDPMAAQGGAGTGESLS